MSITIHHGANGSYKTAGVVNDFLIPAAKQGRVVVTNIRGVSRERTFLHMPDIPDSFDVICIDTDTREGRYKIATWFHWVPLGALCLFDESGVMFPKAWRQKDLDALDYPGGTDAASADGRPANWVEAWEMHRHFNWDIVLTAPNIKSIRDDIRQTTEGAYKHKNKALLGPIFSGYKEGYHDAQKNGQAVSDFDVIRDKRVDPLAFRLYDSTKTGKAQQTLNGFNLFKSPRIVFALGISVCAALYGITTGGLDIFLGDRAPPAQPIDAAPDKTPVPAPAAAVQATKSDPGARVQSAEIHPDQGRNHDPVDVADRPVHQAGVIASGPLTGLQLWISGSIERVKFGTYVYSFSLVINGDPFEYISTDLEQLGYRVIPKGTCAASIKYQDLTYPVSCIPLVLREQPDGVASERRNVEHANAPPPTAL